jgi:hypothetical protein
MNWNRKTPQNSLSIIMTFILYRTGLIPRVSLILKAIFITSRRLIFLQFANCSAIKKNCAVNRCSNLKQIYKCYKLKQCREIYSQTNNIIIDDNDYSSPKKTVNYSWSHVRESNEYPNAKPKFSTFVCKTLYAFEANFFGLLTNHDRWFKTPCSHCKNP